MPQRKLEITAAGIRTLAKSTEEAQKINKGIISQQTEQDVHFANFSKQNSRVLKIKVGEKVYVTGPRSVKLRLPRDNKRKSTMTLKY